MAHHQGLVAPVEPVQAIPLVLQVLEVSGLFGAYFLSLLGAPEAMQVIVGLLLMQTPRKMTLWILGLLVVGVAEVRDSIDGLVEEAVVVPAANPEVDVSSSFLPVGPLLKAT